MPEQATQNPVPAATTGESVAQWLTARGYRRFPAPTGSFAAALWQRRVGTRPDGEGVYVEVNEYGPLPHPAPPGPRYEVEACFDRSAPDGTWAKVLIYGYDGPALVRWLGAAEESIVRARTALTGASHG